MDGLAQGTFGRFDKICLRHPVWHCRSPVPLCALCSFGGSLLQRYQAKWLVLVGLTVDVLSIAVLAYTQDATICILSRFVLGLAQAYLIMFLPVWIDEFSPEENSTTWMSIAQAGVPMGIMIGYLISGFLAANTTWSWRCEMSAAT